MKKLIAIGATLLAALSLAACGSSNSGTDNGGKTVESSKNTKTTTKPSKKKSSSSNEVTNGQLLKVGQWKNDDMQGKMELAKIATINKTLTVSKYSVILKDFKMFEVTPKDNDQKKLAADSFASSTGVTTPYYEIQIQYAIKNTSANPVQFNGISSLVTSTGQQLDSNGGMSDQGVGAEVAAGATKDTAVQALITTSDKDKLSSITLNFDSFCNTSDFSDLGTLPVTKIDL
ncbi:hypothetical protein ACFQ3L_01070 [Lacticaseibacillus jixianensis]|uniref:Lipoprotein n=1 Tax=Lacticaseibacillus jixianensis TaxID=2486012 RepID=A0ABW4B5Q0_9LACO|nr:hypothetical protein [Lacticaseibacillus jixianensis]